jgi:hypothetical protein
MSDHVPDLDRSETDNELTAMRVIVIALDDLDVNERGRVLRWAAERFSISMRP